DIMHVALDGRHNDFASRLAWTTSRGFFGLQEGHQVGDGFFHDAGALEYLRQEHFAGTEEIAHHVHAVHERTLDELQGSLKLVSRFFNVSVNEVNNTVDQRVLQAFCHGCLTPGRVRGARSTR